MVLEAAISAAGVTQRAFARRAGVDQGTLQAILAGRRKPKLADLEPWADALHLTGTPRTAFLEAGWIVLSPPPIAALVDALRADARRSRRR